MDPDDKRVFSLVHAEKLSFSVCDKVLQHLEAEILGFSGMYNCECFINVTIMQTVPCQIIGLS